MLAIAMRLVCTVSNEHWKYDLALRHIHPNCFDGLVPIPDGNVTDRQCLSCLGG